MSDNAVEKDFEDEQKYLDGTLAAIHRLIDKSEVARDKRYTEATKLGEYLWEEQSGFDPGEYAESYHSIERHADLSNQAVKQLRDLYKALDNAYVGSITLDIDGEKETYHIGITSVVEDYDFYVNDWRSPIASIFYNSSLGPTQFEAPAGFISCNLEQRKQIKVKGDKVLKMTRSTSHITDEELQDVLNQTSTGKMQNIVYTIQEEQNKVIRNLKDKKMIVQGCAGSGKTSVALHRLAYLLYNDKYSNSNNMLILSPNDVFSSYISNVLPSLGESNALQTTFSRFAKSFVKGFDKIESYTEFVSRYREKENSEEQNKLNAFKFSNEYKEALDRFIKRKSDSYRFQEDFSYSGINIPMSYLNKVAENLTGVPLKEKIEILSDEIYKLIKVGGINKGVIRTKVAKEFIKPAFNPKALYNEFLTSEEFVSAYGKPAEKVSKKLGEYPDVIGILYLNFEMLGYPKNNLIHHLVIDEVQDYTPLQIEMLAKIFSGATMTVFGDANQTINPYFKYESLEEMKPVLGAGTQYVELNKAYRSSRPIMEYAKDIIGDTKIEPVREATDNPVVVKTVTRDQLFFEIIKDVLDFKDKGLERICITTKNEKEARAIYETLKGFIDNLTILTNDSKEDSSFLVAPAYMTKGLEFDAVINYNSLEDEYGEEDRYTYYVACTRAQHELVVYNEPKMKKKVMTQQPKKEEE